MLEKLKNFITTKPKFLVKFKKAFAEPVKVLALCYAVVIILLILTMYYMCVTAWIYGKDVFSSLLQLLEKCVSVTFVAALVFLGGCFVDSDKDGIPDSIDKFNDKKEENK